jgi:hypothetical protein
MAMLLVQVGEGHSGHGVDKLQDLGSTTQRRSYGLGSSASGERIDCHDGTALAAQQASEFLTQVG